MPQWRTTLAILVALWGMLGIALLAIVWATWIAIGGGTSLAAHERPIAGMVAGARRAETNVHRR